MEKIEKCIFEKKVDEFRKREGGGLMIEFSDNNAHIIYNGKSTQCIHAMLLLKFDECTISEKYIMPITSSTTAPCERDTNTLKNLTVLIDTSKPYNLKVYLYDTTKNSGFIIRKKSLESNDLLFFYVDTPTESIMLLADHESDTLLPMVNLVSAVSDEERNFLRKTSCACNKWIKD